MIKKLLIFIGRLTWKILLISLPSFIVAFVLLETITRISLPASDSPDIYYDRVLGIMYLPNQTGNYIVGKKSEINARFRINANGWNSPHDYEKEKPEDTIRIAVIGDSFVESFQVDYDKSYPYLLEEKLKESGNNAQVYTFGHSGANLIHYLKVFEWVKEQYSPDITIVNLVDNDFKESFYGIARTDNWSIAQDNNIFLEIAPSPTKNVRLKKLFRKSALVRYLTINLGIPDITKLINRDTSDSLNLPSIMESANYYSKLLDYSLEKIIETAGDDTVVVLVLDSDRQSIYQEKPSELAEIGDLIKKKTKKTNIIFLDLDETFQNSWNEERAKFEWEIDDHWNPFAHGLIVETLFDLLMLLNNFSY